MLMEYTCPNCGPGVVQLDRDAWEYVLRVPLRVPEFPIPSLHTFPTRSLLSNLETAAPAPRTPPQPAADPKPRERKHEPQAPRVEPPPLVERAWNFLGSGN
jgi:hypothetical protein